MKRCFWALFLALLALSLLPAQEAGLSGQPSPSDVLPPTGEEAPAPEQDMPPEEAPEGEAVEAPPAAVLPESVDERDFYANGPGDSIFSIQLGANLPLFFQKVSDGSADKTNLSAGPLLSLRYMGFVAKDFAIGGELGAGFNISLRKRVLFSVPMSFELMWMPTKMPFELPLGLGLGGILYRMDDYTSFCPIIRPMAGLSWRADSSWSFGGSLSYDWVPMITSWNPDISYYGNFLTLKLSAHYHL